MKVNYSLEELVQILTEKGYTDYFQTQATYPGKLMESLEKFFKNEPEYKKDILLRTYLQWNGEEKPSIECYMWIQQKDNGFGINKMNVEHRDRYWQLIKQVNLRDLTIQTLPTAKEAIRMITDMERKNIKPVRKQFGL